MVYLIVLLVVVVVVVLLMRAAAAPGDGRPRAQVPRRPRPPARPLAPDDDPEFLRELQRRTRRDDGRTS